MFIRKKILIIDGVEMTRHYLRHALTNAGYVTEAVSNTQEAIKLTDEEDFDVFFVDIHLPELAGIKFIKAIREIEDYNATPILAMTTANIESLRKKGEAIGITDWVKKPISPPHVLQMLKQLQLVNVHQVQSLV